MGILVLSRRSITYRQPGSGEVTVLYIPGQDQVQVVKDLAGMNDSTLQGKSLARGPQLARVFSGQRYIYGYLSEEITEIQEAVKVWLPEDFAPRDAQAFFYVITPELVIHGVRETSDEGQQSWRAAQLTMSGADPFQSLLNAITDYVLANSGAVVCVAVLNQLELYRRLQSALEVYEIAPVPFSTLKPRVGLRPLYRQFDFTLLYLTGVLFGVLLLVASGGFYYFNWSQLEGLKRDIANVQSQIKAIQINQSIGYIKDPQPMLDSMAKAFNQQPSAIVDAAASVAIQFGDLEHIALAIDGKNSGNKEKKLVTFSYREGRDKMLVEQEARARKVLENRPWVRELSRAGGKGREGQMVVLLQTEGALEPTAQVLEQANQSARIPEPEISTSLPKEEGLPAVEAPAGAEGERPAQSVEQKLEESGNGQEKAGEPTGNLAKEDVSAKEGENPSAGGAGGAPAGLFNESPEGTLP